MPGLTAAGLEISTIADVRDQTNAKWRKAFGSSMDVSDASPDGQTIGIVSETFALLWELLEVITSSMDRRKATGALLRSICALTGTTPIPAAFSTVIETLTGVPTTAVPVGSLVATASTGQHFTTTADRDGTIAAVAAWTASTAYTLGERRTNGGNVYQCTVAGTGAATGGPSGKDVSIVDGAVRWRFLGPGTGAVDVIARATVTGPTVAAAGDLTNIITPSGGWLGAINLLDATLGRKPMTDPQLRALAEQEVAQPGTSPPDAIRAALLRVGQGTDNPVTAATVFVNANDVTDADGLPPHRLEALVHGGRDQDIWDALRVNVAGGTLTHGSVVGTSTDSSGRPQVMRFSRTTEVLIFVSVTLVKDPNTYPADGDDQVRLAIATWGNTREDGDDVVSAAVLARVFTVPGVRDAQLPLISASPQTVPTSTATIAITSRQRAVFDTGRITVTSTNGSP